MGILNITPDSFFDGGRHRSAEDALAHALRMVEDGAHIIDVGGESTRPFADEVAVDEELRRVIPVIEEIRARTDAIISVDTYKAKVAHEACLAGADMINDISGLSFDDRMASVAAAFDAHLVIMHIKGTPKDMQANPHYDDVIGEILAFFRDQTDKAIRAGVRRERVILDPGVGFGKRLEDNLRIHKMLGEFRKLGRPILMGTSMKSFIGKVTDAPVEERLSGSLASVAVSVMNGADIIRVHHVKETRQVVTLVHAIMES